MDASCSDRSAAVGVVAGDVAGDVVGLVADDVTGVVAGDVACGVADDVACDVVEDGLRGGAGSAVGDIVVLAEMRENRLSVDECLTAVRLPDVGAIALFVGTVRDHDHGRSVADLEYSAHPRAAAEISRVAIEVASDLRVRAVAVVHRTGLLAIGDVAVVVAVGAAHRGAALTACRRIIDDVKEQVPIWKRQAFTDGSTEWVGAC